LGIEVVIALFGQLNSWKDKIVRIELADGDELVAKVICAIDEDDVVIVELISAKDIHRYRNADQIPMPAYEIRFDEIERVELV